MIPLFQVAMDGDAPTCVADTLMSGWVGQGERVEEFEVAFAQALNLPRGALMTSSCTAAIDLALHLCGVGPGDYVISTPMTCAATNCAIVNRGATIIWADVDPITGLINAESARWLPQAKAIVAVDWAGRACDYAALCSLGVPVIGDCAHRLSRWDDAEHAPDYLCWSFQAIKFLTTGDGGALFCPLDQVARARNLRWFGLDRSLPSIDQDLVEAGYKYAPNDIAATIGLANLEHATAAVWSHQERAKRYHFELNGLRGVTLPPFDPTCSYWLYTILVDDRPAFMDLAKARGVTVGEVHRRNDKLTAFRRHAVPLDPVLPGLDYFAAHQINLPVGWWLTTEDEETIIRLVRDFSAGARAAA